MEGEVGRITPDLDMTREGGSKKKRVEWPGSIVGMQDIVEVAVGGAGLCEGPRRGSVCDWATILLLTWLLRVKNINAVFE